MPVFLPFLTYLNNIWEYISGWSVLSSAELCSLTLSHCPPSLPIQPMRPLRAAATTSQPVLTIQQVETIFYKIQEIFQIHKEFYDALYPNIQQWDEKVTVGHLFQKLVSGTWAWCSHCFWVFFSPLVPVRYLQRICMWILKTRIVRVYLYRVNHPSNLGCVRKCVCAHTPVSVVWVHYQKCSSPRSLRLPYLTGSCCLNRLFQRIM